MVIVVIVVVIVIGMLSWLLLVVGATSNVGGFNRGQRQYYFRDGSRFGRSRCHGRGTRRRYNNSTISLLTRCYSLLTSSMTLLKLLMLLLLLLLFCLLLSSEMEKMREFLIAAGVSEDLLAQFDLQHVGGGGLSQDERMQLREERHQRFASYKEVLTAQTETMETARTLYSKSRKIVVGEGAARSSSSSGGGGGGGGEVTRTLTATSPPKVSSLTLNTLSPVVPYAQRSGKSDGSPHGGHMHAGGSQPSFSRQSSAAVGKLSRLSSIRGPVSTSSSRLSSEREVDDEADQSDPDGFGMTGTKGRVNRQFSIDRSATNARKSIRGGTSQTPGSDDKEELIALGPTASLTEINMRRTLLSNLIESIGINAAKKAINATAESIHTYSNMLNAAQTAMWDSISLNKKSLDYHIKLKTIMEAVVSCAMPGTMIHDVDKMMSELAPIMAMALGGAFTTEWNVECNLPTVLMSFLNVKAPPVNRAPDFFVVGNNDKELYERFEMIRSSVVRMSRYTDNAYATGTEFMHKVINEWRDVKSIAIDVHDLLKKEGDRVRQILSKELESVKVDSLKYDCYYLCCCYYCCCYFLQRFNFMFLIFSVSVFRRLKRQVNELLDENAGLSKTISDMALDYENLKALPVVIEEKDRQIRVQKDHEDDLNAVISVCSMSYTNPSPSPSPY